MGWDSAAGDSPRDDRAIAELQRHCFGPGGSSLAPAAGDHENATTGTRRETHTIAVIIGYTGKGGQREQEFFAVIQPRLAARQVSRLSRLGSKPRLISPSLQPAYVRTPG